MESLKAETVVRAEGIVRDRPDEDINKVLLKYMIYLQYMHTEFFYTYCFATYIDAILSV